VSDILNRANTYLASLGETSLHDGHPAVIVRELSEALASAREGNGTLTASLERCTDRIEALERERKSLNQSREEIEADYNEMHDRYYNTVDSLSASQAEASRLREALAQARIWHEAEDKSLSKQPPSHGPNGNQWARLQHQEQMAEIGMIGEPDCSGRRRFSKRQRPLSKRLDWCPWCQTILKGTDGCPVRAALEKP